MFVTAAVGITRTMQEEGSGRPAIGVMLGAEEAWTLGLAAALLPCVREMACSARWRGDGGARVLASGAVGRRAAGRQGAAVLLVPREQEEGHGWLGDLGPAMQRRSQGLGHRDL